MMGGFQGNQEISAQAAYDGFWPKATEEIRTMDMSALKHQELPLARIKKVGSTDGRELAQSSFNLKESSEFQGGVGG